MTAAAAVDKRVQVERVLCDIFALMEFPATLEFKEAPDGGLAVAVHFQSEVPGVQAGKRSTLIDSLQFLVNKVVNRPGVERRLENRYPQGNGSCKTRFNNTAY